LQTVGNAPQVTVTNTTTITS